MLIQTEGSQTAVISTEHTLATITDSGVYVFVVDLSALVNGDIVTLRMKTKLTSDDASQLAYDAIYANLQSRQNVYSPPVPSPVEIIATLQQTAGTGRNFTWAIYRL